MPRRVELSKWNVFQGGLAGVFHTLFIAVFSTCLSMQAAETLELQEPHAGAPLLMMVLDTRDNCQSPPCCSNTSHAIFVCYNYFNRYSSQSRILCLSLLLKITHHDILRVGGGCARQCPRHFRSAGVPRNTAASIPSEVQNKARIILKLIRRRQL